MSMFVHCSGENISSFFGYRCLTSVVKRYGRLYGIQTRARADINKRILCSDWLGNKYL